MKHDGTERWVCPACGDPLVFAEDGIITAYTCSGCPFQCSNAPTQYDKHYLGMLLRANRYQGDQHAQR